MTASQHHDDPERTSPVGMARFSSEFMEAALAADAAMRQGAGHHWTTPFPVLFQAGQAIELILKSYLLSRGVTLQKVRKDYGHNLRRALRKAKELGLLSLVEITAEEDLALEVLDDLYSTKQLQYIVIGAARAPHFEPLRQLALKLIHAVSMSVGYAARRLPLPAPRGPRSAPGARE